MGTLTTRDQLKWGCGSDKGYTEGDKAIEDCGSHKGLVSAVSDASKEAMRSRQVVYIIHAVFGQGKLGKGKGGHRRGVKQKHTLRTRCLG